MTEIAPYYKTIPLTQDKEAKVSYWWWAWLSQWKWHAHFHHGNWYACRADTGRRKLLRLHRVVLGLSNPKILGDHIDLDGLNNTEGNLRIATTRQNSKNTRSRKGSSSKYLGVNLHRTKYKTKESVKEVLYWQSQICVNYKRMSLGFFPHTPCGELLAALKYDEAAIKYHGEFANINFKKL